MKANILISAATVEEESEIAMIITKGLAARGIAVSYIITADGVSASDAFIRGFERNETIVTPADPIATVNVFH